ncbi:MAG: phosphotransferase family protein [Proteobacteria bacterium]|nr:phosphotransferase family protein [Pseudomonadota bacterium]
MAKQIEAYAAHRLTEARDVSVEGLDRIVGGASRETYRFRLRYASGGESVDRGVILRRDPPGSVIETDRRNEFNAYRAFAGVPDVPVPEVFWLEEEGTWLDYPFFMLEEIAGFESSPAAIGQPPYAERREQLGHRKWEILGRIAAADPAAIGLTGCMQAPAPEDCWRRELDYWEGVIDADELSPWPIARAAIRRLRRSPPPPAQKLSVVHGDFRTGNFLYDGQGGIHAILDWEMVHLGDPLEDLGWTFNPLWDFAGNGYMGSLLARDEAIRTWERSSGLCADPDALGWWELFNAVKGQAIWVSSAREFIDGKNHDPIMGMAGLGMANKQDRALLEIMGKPT